MVQQIKIWCILLTLGTLIGCRQDMIVDEEVIITEPTTDVSGNLMGRVIDADSKGIDGATLFIGNEITTTDAYGFFSVDDIDIPNSGLYIKAEKDGFFTGGTAVYANPTIEDSQDLEVRLRLISLPVANVFSAADGVDLEFDDGAKIQIPVNSVLIGDQLYNGDVSIYTTWLDPSDTRELEYMPGALTGETADGNIQALQTFGMIAVEMRSENGEELQLAPETEATLTFPIPDILNSAAPSSIPLWHFDEQRGLWVEEGVAEKEDNAYVGTVSHFSWWNCDVPYPLVNLCINFENLDGQEIENVAFNLYSSIYGNTQQSTLGSSFSCGQVPQDETLELSILDACENVIYTEDIGPFSDDNNEVTIKADYSSNVTMVHVSGSILDCDGQAARNGFVEIETDNSVFFDNLLETGEYSIFVSLCDSEDSIVNITGVNVDDLTKGEAEIDLTGQTEFDYDITTCEEFMETYLIINGDSTNYNNCLARQTGIETLITAGDFHILGFNGFETGEFPGNWVTGNGSVTNGVIDGATFNISRYDEVGGYIVGTFEDGTFSGSFVAERVR